MQKIRNKGMAGTIPVYCTHDKIVPVNELKPNPKNPNRHPGDQVELLAKVIKAQGWRQPVKVSTLSGLIVSGHGRYEAALLLGCPVPVDYQDYPSPEEELSDLLADNRISELSEMDDKKLIEIFRDIDTSFIEEGVTGYTEEEIERLTGALLYTEAEPDDYGDEFQLNDSECPLFRTMTFHLDEEQYDVIIRAFDLIKARGEISEGGSSNENGKCLYKVVTEWEEQKKLLLK